MKVAILKYKAGNIYSVINSLRRLGIDPILTDDIQEISSADKVILPGQGEARSVMNYLNSHNLNKVICDLQQPVLGICIGMQLMCRHSEEGNTDCLDIFHSDVKRFIAKSHYDKIPAVGWNEISNFKSPLFKNFPEKDFVYFIHSYYVPISDYTIASTNYILPYSAALNYKNFYAVQFHPEKSGNIGEKILSNFLSI